jgi:hypothetical protein
MSSRTGSSGSGPSKNVTRASRGRRSAPPRAHLRSGYRRPSRREPALEVAGTLPVPEQAQRPSVADPPRASPSVFVHPPGSHLLLLCPSGGPGNVRGSGGEARDLRGEGPGEGPGRAGAGPAGSPGSPERGAAGGREPGPYPAVERDYHTVAVGAASADRAHSYSCSGRRTDVSLEAG